MFGFFKKKPKTPERASPKPTAAASEAEIANALSDRVKEAFSRGDADEIVRVLKSAYETHEESEGPAGWVAGIIGEKNVVPLFGLLKDFVDRFPASLYSVRAIYADFLASQGKFDEAAQHARIYLRLAADAGKLPRLENLRIIKDGVARAIAILMVPYAALGALSYAKRVLRFGSDLGVDADWKLEYAQQLARLEVELSQPAKQELDGKWEDFFASAAHAAELSALCGQRGFPHIADRIDLIEGKFRCLAGYRADATEMLALVQEFSTEDGKSGKGLI